MLISMPTAMPSPVLSLVLLLIPRLVTATCYWQNSTLAPDNQYSIATDDTACFPEQDNSPCCGTGWTCLSDGVCFINIDDGDYYYRGTCTDRTWDSQQCPGWCFAQNSNTSIPMAKCNTAQDWYCCPGDSECSCDTGKNAVKLGDAQPSTVTVIGSTSWPGITSTTAPFTQSSPLVTDGTSTSESAGSITSSGSTTRSTSSATSTSSGSGTAAAASSTSNTPPVSSSSGSSNTALAAGLGAGLGGAAVVIGVLLFFLVRSRRRRNANKAAAGGLHNSGKPPSSGDPMVQKHFYGSQPISPYSDSQHYVVAEAPPSNYKLELAGAGEYNRAEMPTESNGSILSRNAAQRAELPS